MAMELHGRSPTSEAGEHFDANVWQWRAIHDLIVGLCSDLFDEETLYLLGGNDGAGPEDQAVCAEVAKRFEKWVEEHPEGHVFKPHLKVTRDGQIINVDELAEEPGGGTRPLYRVGADHLKLWVEFLRNCGGFEVW